MNDERTLLVDTLLACCDRLAGAEQVPLMYLDDVGRVCATLRPLLADADTPEELALQNLIWRTEEIVVDWALKGVSADASLPDWARGDPQADYVAWETARAELAEIRGEGSDN